MGEFRVRMKFGVFLTCTRKEAAGKGPFIKGLVAPMM
jgi:hypothetical protein